MSMFRSPKDYSSDSESSESDVNGNEYEVIPSYTAEKPKPAKKGARSPGLQDNSHKAENGDSANTNELEADIEGHSNMMTAALLEFYCLSRAADILNAQHGSHKQYTRDSPEVQYLGKKMYNYKSQFLSSHGVIAGGLNDEELQTTRQYYRDNLDLLGMSALEELKIDDSQRRVPSASTGGDLILASKSKKHFQLNSDAEFTGPAKTRLYRPKIADIGKRLPSAENIRALENVHLDVGSLPSQSLPLTGSSPASFPLFDNKLSAPQNHPSRYAMEFSQVKVIGRGSFGEVYHVKNHIDGQAYAVKKIPISQRRLAQLQKGGENQLESIMKEIRTLARLEHTNVVRYYGAWIEQVHLSGYVHESHQVHVEVETESTQSALVETEQSDSQSFGVVFEHSNSSIQNVETEEDTESIPRDFGDFTMSQTSTFGGTDDDIFTDGLSYDPSKMQIQRRGSQVPAVILHIQMSLHPMSLSSYLNPQACETSDGQNAPRRHCFHLIPSLQLVISIISGVEYLHSKGIVHRDLKPANIFLSCPEHTSSEGCSICQSENGCPFWYSHPRIGDFGLVADISHFNERQPNSSDPPINHSPKIQRVVGTEFYRPPLVNSGIGVAQASEPNTHYPIDESLDVYALGVILFELLYRLNTKMERQFVLSELTRGPHGPSTGSSWRHSSLPADFAQKVDLGHVKFEDGITVGDALIRCIGGMLEPLHYKRWRCADVKRHLQMILAVVQKMPAT
ncbi:kinase-like domain-containing protein [Aspergillus avenaceus]|uniref:Kinase-like domain-containing protein n=1 Tax=Aspergillus avenaceus TaxID=36643 RepID=A0A5N6U850_ASPAV|nr:kinase-like domain-containing protein [Aspergillus avenaceus]